MLINELPKHILESRVKLRESQDVRSPYFRDSTAIIHSSPFRRLKHKTQVFFAPKNDHICTRIEHVLHVASIASTICNAMNLDYELAWAIGLGHDLGHTPFGHIGERIISSIMVEKGLSPFEHEINSLRVVDFLSPLNLTYAVRDGIISHCGETVTRTISPSFEEKDFSSIKTRAKILPSTWEGCIVRASDQIAYMGRDFEDAVRLGIVDKDDLPSICKKLLGDRNSIIIDALVRNLIQTSEKEGMIAYSEPVFEAVQQLIKFNTQKIYKSDALIRYEKYFDRLIRLIYKYLSSLFDTYGFEEKPYTNEGNILATGFYSYMKEKQASYLEHDKNYNMLIFDYIAGMTDNFCLDAGNEILQPLHLDYALENRF